MLPNTKVQNLISRHSELERELSSGEVDKKNFAEKSKEYSELNEIIKEANEYILFEKNKNELEKIANDAKNEKEIKDLAKLELEEKRIPFIIRRPIANGSSEYWNIKDLEILVN